MIITIIIRALYWTLVAAGGISLEISEQASNNSGCHDNSDDDGDGKDDYDDDQIIFFVEMYINFWIVSICAGEQKILDIAVKIWHPSKGLFSCNVCR